MDNDTMTAYWTSVSAVNTRAWTFLLHDNAEVPLIVLTGVRSNSPEEFTQKPHSYFPVSKV